MASKVLMVPEEHLHSVCEIIRRGLKCGDWGPEVTTPLQRWCREQEAYLKSLKEEK